MRGRKAKEESETEMNDLKKSDSAMVAKNPANNGPSGSAEPGERRAGPKGNPGGQGSRRAQKRGSGSQAADRMRKAATRNPEERLVALLHHVTTDALAEAFHSLKSDVAAGVDGVTWEMYAEGLEDRLIDLHGRVHRGAYRAPPSRRAYMPKEDGGQRPLGIASLEDKILQRAVTDTILVPIHETEFLGFSHGFRPGRGTHNALDAIAVGMERRKVSWIVDADIRGFFDNLGRDHLVRMLERRIGDVRVMRLIVKWLDAGVMEGTDWTDTGRGVPQGGTVSPILANVCLHHVLDVWFHNTWRKRIAGGDTIIVRHADDFVCGFQHEGDAKRFLRDLGERLALFGLELHPDKTRLIEFGRFAKANRRNRGQGKPETFDFLGMTHFCDESRKGRFRVGRKPSRKRVNRTLRRIKERLRERWHDNRHDTAAWLGRVINGWLNHYAVPGRGRHLERFVHLCKRLLWRALRRRSQRDRTEWEDIDLLTAVHWPKVGIRHPWPSQRLVVRNQGRSPVR